MHIVAQGPLGGRVRKNPDLAQGGKKSRFWYRGRLEKSTGGSYRNGTGGSGQKQVQGVNSGKKQYGGKSGEKW